MSSNNFEAVIGLEVHVQLKTQSKIFSADSTEFNSGDNENVSPVSMGMPGSLPVLNRQAVDLAIKTGLALGCKISHDSVFSRKNYFYPDLPKGYQISQHDKPLCADGHLVFRVGNEIKTVRIERAHMEEDAGKSSHQGDSTLINYNRAGIPLLEIVSAPDMRSPQEAAEYARALRQIVRYLDVCDGNLEEGSMRCDCNVSIRRKGETKLGTKVELKNINSFRFVEKAIDYEIHRQIECLERGEKIIQETRLYDSDKNRTISMRSKEDAQDYRYFPDPDLLPLRNSIEKIESLRKTIPELPIAKKTRFVSEFQIQEQDAEIICSERETAEYFEKAARLSGNAKASANWMMTELLREMNEAKTSVDQAKIQPQHLAELIQLIDRGTISGKIAKTVFSEMWLTGEHPEKIVAAKGLLQITDRTAIEKMIDEILDQNKEVVASYLGGKEKSFGFLVGAAMKASKGKASPDLVNQILKERLNKK